MATNFVMDKHTDVKNSFSDFVITFVFAIHFE